MLSWLNHLVYGDPTPSATSASTVNATALTTSCPLPFKPPKEPRQWPHVHWNGMTYAISAYLPPEWNDTKHQGERPSELYLKTRSKAVAHYCLFGHDAHELGDLRPLDVQSEEYRMACLRLRRCGAVEMTWAWWFNSFYREDFADGKLGTYVAESVGYIFGWPSPTEQGGFVKQPVYVYNIKARPPKLFTPCGEQEPGDDEEVDKITVDNSDAFVALVGSHSEALTAPYAGIEAMLRVFDLANCETMEAYCEKLESWGAVYHEDVELCLEAQYLGLATL